jgi:hypothetical protein
MRRRRLDRLIQEEIEMTLQHRPAPRRFVLSNRIALAAALALALAVPASAARFVNPLLEDLGGWNVRVFTTDGTVIDGEVRGMRSRSHGLDRITVIDASGARWRLAPAEIRFLVVPVNGADLPDDIAEVLATILRPDYEPTPEVRELLFEPVVWPKRALLLQRINPGWDRRIQVYAVPADKKSDPPPDDVTRYRKSILYRTLRGDEWKNTYVAVKDGKAIKVDAEWYGRSFEELFGDCQAVLDRYPRGERDKFRHFADHVLAYEMHCGAVGAPGSPATHQPPPR